MRGLVGLDVHAAGDLSWNELTNGLLLQAAEKSGFDVLLNADQNMAYQQNNKKRAIALLVLNTNKLTLLERSVDTILQALARAGYEFVELTPPSKRKRRGPVLVQR